MTEPRQLIKIAALADYPQLVPEVVAIAWEEWGEALAEDPRERWLREADLDSRLHVPTSAAFVAVAGDRAVGTVQLHEFEIDAIRDRSPWVCGMVVRPEYRNAGVGRGYWPGLSGSPQNTGCHGCGCSPNTRPGSTRAAAGSGMARPSRTGNPAWCSRANSRSERAPVRGA